MDLAPELVMWQEDAGRNARPPAWPGRQLASFFAIIQQVHLNGKQSGEPAHGFLRSQPAMMGSPGFITGSFLFNAAELW
jgi:hypothetical protein